LDAGSSFDFTSAIKLNNAKIYGDSVPF
jgi:hypothetical protein